MSYSVVADLLTGNIPVPPYVDSQKVVNDAADEIDSIIGFRYVTPVVLVETPENRPTILFLKRVNNHLASGRLLMEVAAAQEDTTLHAYAKRLVDESLLALSQVAMGEMVLDATLLTSAVEQSTGPLQFNKDAFSQVDAFYDDVVFAPQVYVAERWPD